MTSIEKEKLNNYMNELMESNNSITVREVINKFKEKFDIQESFIYKYLKSNEKFSFKKKIRENSQKSLKIKDFFSNKFENFIRFRYLDVILILLNSIFFLIFSFFSIEILFFIYIKMFIGLINSYLVPGFLIHQIFLINKKLNKLERCSTIFGLSFMITSFYFLLYNWIFSYIGEIVNISYAILNIALIGIYFLLKYKNLERYNNSGLNLIKVFKSYKYFLLIFILTIIIYLLIKSWNVFQTPLLNSSSDPWIHYAVVRDILNNNYFSFDYYSIYNFYLPIWYVSLTAFKLVTGLGLINALQLFTLFIGIGGILFISTLTLKFTKRLKIVMAIGLSYSIINPFIILYTSLIWPQFLGHVFIPFSLIFLFLLQEKGDIYNSVLLISSFILILFSHIISALVLIGIIVFIAITLFFAKKINKYMIISGLICILFFLFWSLLYYKDLFFSMFQITMGYNLNPLNTSILSTTFIIDYQKIINFGIILLLIVGFLSVAYLFAKKYELTHFFKYELKFSVKTILIILAIVLIVTNPFFWYFVPLKNEYFQQLPIFIYILNFIVFIIPIFFTILGVSIIFTAKGIRNYNILAWGISIAFIGTMIIFLQDIIFGGRVLSFGFDFITVVTGVGMFFLVERFKNMKQKYVIFISILLIALPFPLIIRNAHLYGIGTTSYSDYCMYQTLGNHYNRSNYVLSDFRMDYLTIGIFWDRESDLKIIGDVNTSDGYKLAVYPENLNYLLNYIKEIANNTGLKISKILVPISNSYISIGPLDAAVRDNVIPSRILTQEDFNFYNNHSIYDKIFDNGNSMAYIINIL
ncbi:MAG: hypothetical protein EAX96_20115 [Candidatus Lokiarchaeota archaeon]|nr:hypothetical protein [Candidatus Lokiarchaeota archaeon]